MMPKWRVKIKKINMSDYLRQFGQWGLVAGAAEGLGAAYCEELARKGVNVIMVDIQEDKMETLARRLENSYGIKTRLLVQDLAMEEAPERCMQAINELGCRLLIYNAAYSRVKPFLSAGPEEPDLYVDVNVRAPLKLVYAFVRKLKSNNHSGGILLMSSLAGLWGTKFVAMYSGTKAFNLLLAEALSHELKPYNIKISACCAGAIATPGYLGSHPARGFGRPGVMDPNRVAFIALKRLGRKTVIIPGFSNRLSCFLLTRILPRRISSFLVNNTMGRTYRGL
jgi:short-subunit dehydrogenase